MIPKPSLDDERLAAFRNVGFTYEDGTEALHEITFDIWKGEHIGLVGGNGSGKTTLAKHLNGLLKPSHGQVYVGGADTRRESVARLARTVGYVFQNPDHQLFCPTVTEEVQFGPRNFGLPESEINEKSQRALELMSITHLEGEAPMSLSLGDRRRVSIASVIATDPEMLILDEPFTGLDARETDTFMKVIDTMNRDGKTIILITHDMQVMAEHSERVILLDEGRVVLDCRTRKIFSELETLRDSGLTPPPIIQLAQHLGEYGVSEEILTVDELAKEITRILGGHR